MRRLWWFAASLAAACGSSAKPEAGPIDRLYLPTGVAVHRFGGAPADARLLVASSNSDLRFDTDTGGSVIAFDPAPDAVVRGGVNVPSLGGDLAVALDAVQDPAAPDPTHCATSSPPPGAIPRPAALLATRGSNTLQVVGIDAATGALSREDDVALSGRFADPLPVAVACGGGRFRAFVGYLRTPFGEASISEYDLDDRTVRHASLGNGPVRSFAYDARRDRLYVLGLATGTPTPLRWVELGGCRIDLPRGAGGCTVGEVAIPGMTVELRSMALAHPFPGQPQRAFLTGRFYDPAAAAALGGRTVDLGGVLLVVDLREDAFGGVDLELVHAVEGIGRGLQDVRVLPARAGQRDVVAALAIDAGELWIYDDQTRGVAVIGREGGPPILGHQPFGLAVDPDPLATIARLYVGSFADGWVTPLEVPLADPADVPTTAAGLRRIRGGTP